jgi:hypothetical protein
MCYDFLVELRAIAPQKSGKMSLEIDQRGYGKKRKGKEE